MHRPRSVLIVVTLLLTLAGSFVSLATVAQPAPNPCPEGEVYVPEQDICMPADQVPTEAPLPTEIPAGQPTIQRLLLLHYACDAGFDPQLGTGDRNVSCTGANKPAFTYTITFGGQVVTSLTLQTTDEARGRGQLDSRFAQPLLAGEMTIAVEPVEGWMSAWMFCEIDNPETGPRVEEPAIAGNAVTVTLQAGDIVVCDWFNVATGAGEEDQATDPGDGQGVFADPAEATGADITIAAYFCPAGTTAAADLVATCTERASGLTFDLLTATDTVATQTSDAEGDVFFPQVAPGDYGIAETLPSGYGEPIVICYHAFPNGATEEGAEDIVFGNQFRFTIFEPGESLECAWYNVPALGADSGPNIFIEARTCSPGTSISSSMTVFDAQALCQTFYVDLEYRVLNVDEVIATSRTSSDVLSPGQVFFTRLPEPESGGFGVTASVHEGERTLAVFCDQDFGDGSFQVVPVLVRGDRMDQELGMGAGDTMRCTWFIEMSPLLAGTHAPGAPMQEAPPLDATGTAAAMVPTSEPPLDATGTAVQDGADPGETLVEPQDGQASPAANAGDGEAASEVASWEPGITVLALRCPADVAGQDLEVDLTGVCTQPASGLTFEILVDDEPGGTYVTDANGGFVIPAELGAGAYQFRHQPAPEQLELRTVCTAVYENGSTATGRSSAVGSEMSELFLTYDGVSSVTCTMYFVMDSAPPEDQPATEQQEPGDDAANGAAHSLTLQFWTCPEGTDPAAEPVALEQTCAVETSDWSFMLTVNGLTTGETVPGTGTWTFDDPVVSVDIGPTQPGKVQCTSTWAAESDGGDQRPATTMLDGGLLTVEVSEPATSVSCDWFLLPD